MYFDILIFYRLLLFVFCLLTILTVENFAWIILALKKSQNEY